MPRNAGSHVVLKASNGLAEDGDLTLAADMATLFSRAQRISASPW